MADLIERVRAALATVEDPDLHRDLVSLNMIRDLTVADGVARFSLVLTTNACPVKQELEDQVRAAAEGVEGISRAEVTVTAEAPKQLRDEDPLPDVGQIIAVASGKGGVGKSTVTVNLACALQSLGAQVGILDADIYGPSIPLMMGCDERPLVDQKKMVPPTNHDIPMMSMGFLVEPGQAMIWRGPMLMGAIKQFITDVRWGTLDYLLLDLPPGTGDVPMTLAQSVPLSGAVIVTTPQSVALLDVDRGIAMFRKLEVPILGVVENMGTYVCPMCQHEEAIFGSGGGASVADREGVPFLGTIPLEPGIRRAGDTGRPIVLENPDSVSGRSFLAVAEHLTRQASIAAVQQQRL
ncbi:MAG: Mrp/NBP35 family ATP-binding protein [Planctomycetota bacterium]